MDLSQFSIEHQQPDIQIQFINQLMYELRTRYEMSLRMLLKELKTDKIDIQISFPHGSGGRYEITESERIVHEADTDSLFVVTHDCMKIPFSDLMTDIQDLFVSHLHIQSTSNRIMNNFVS